MPKKMLELVRESLFQPRIAARYIAELKLPRETVFLGALLLAIVSVLSQYFMFGFVDLSLIGGWSVAFDMPVIDVAFQLARIYLIAQTTVILAKGVRIELRLQDAVKVYVWYNLMLQLLFAIMLLVMIVFGPMALVIVLFVVLWSPYAAAVFWSELLGTKNIFLGFVVAVVAFLIASAISVILASIIGLPVMEIVPNV